MLLTDLLKPALMVLLAMDRHKLVLTVLLLHTTLLVTGLHKLVLTVPLVMDHHKQVLMVLTVLMTPLVTDLLNLAPMDQLVPVVQPLVLMVLLLLVMDHHILVQLLVLVLVQDTVLPPLVVDMAIPVMVKLLLGMVPTLLAAIKDLVPNSKQVLTILMLRLHNYQNICKRKHTKNSKEVTTMLRNHLNLNKIELAYFIE